tara:strand:- start:4808 stop:5197 length:390 start_codon:yes stop_codon:yes gene_type:complete
VARSRHGALVFLLAATLLGTPHAFAQAQGSEQPDASHRAYEAALKCFVANGRAIGLQERAGDLESAARYEQKARLSFDAAVRLGQSLGFSGTRINQDLGIAQGRELPQMVSDTVYFERAVATCRALGLM